MAEPYRTTYEKLMHGKNISRHERAFAAATTGKPRRSVFVPADVRLRTNPAEIPFSTLNRTKASQMRWLDRLIPSGLSLAEQLQFASWPITKKMRWYTKAAEDRSQDSTGYTQYQFDFREYPTRIKKFFLPGTGAGLYNNVEGLRPIPTQRLNIQTSTFKTDPSVYFDPTRNGFGEVAFQEL